MPESLPSAKVVPPRLSHVVPRPRLFTRLDRLRTRPVIWVCGPAGCGKTTLVGSYLEARRVQRLWYQVDAGDADPATFFYYLGLAARRAAPRVRTPLPPLTPEYLPGLATFAARYFERLGARLKPPAVLVFDNLHDADDAAAFHDVLCAGLARLPPGLTTILVSRSLPPPAFARWLANGTMATLGWEELRLVPGESAKLLQQRTGTPLPRATRVRLHEVADGWAAGLVLLLEWTRRGGGEPQARRTLPPDQLFAYFATEVFRRVDAPTQVVLLKTAVLPWVTVTAAETLTGLPAAGTLLARLQHENLFTEHRLAAEPIYQYHPLLREFLLAQGREAFTPAECTALRRQAARLLAAAGETEAAVALLAEAADWETLGTVIQAHAPTLLAQGRHRTLGTWLSHLPAAAIGGNAWLQYWSGAARLPFDPMAARDAFEAAFAAGKASGDATATLLAWAGAVDACLYGFADFAALDRWIGEMDALTRTLGTFPTPEIEARVAAAMVTALAFRQPWRADLDTWASRGLAIEMPDASGAQAQIRWVLGYHGVNMGQLGHVAAGLDHLRKIARSPELAPLIRINAILVEASYYHVAGDHEAVLRATADGLELARREGIHILDNMLLAQAASSTQDVNDWWQARVWLEQMESSVSASPIFDATVYHHLKAREALIRGDPRAALPHSERSVKAIVASGAAFQPNFELVLKARVLHALGREAEAAECLAEAYANAKLTSSCMSQFYALMLDAEMSFDRGAETHGLALLHQALRLGSESGCIHSYVDVPAATARLCARAIEAGIEVPYVKWLIRKRRLTLEEPPYHLDAWPWPLKVYTLGAFRVERDGEPLTFPRKVQQKPLLLLKALIALGGVDVREDAVSDLLWPEAEGDAAHGAFSTTLSRLRDLLGLEQAVRVQEGRLTLDARSCWVDAWAFERLLAQTETRLKADLRRAPEPSRDLAPLVMRALDLYRGPFLPGETAHGWTAAARERLRSKFLQLIARWGEHLAQAGQWQDAVDCYQRGLGVDDLAELLYQRLMACYLQLGLRGETLTTYRRCRRALAALGIAPSPKTEAIRHAVQAPAL